MDKKSDNRKRKSKKPGFIRHAFEYLKSPVSDKNPDGSQSYIDEARQSGWEVKSYDEK